MKTKERKLNKNQIKIINDLIHSDNMDEYSYKYLIMIINRIKKEIKNDIGYTTPNFVLDFD